MEFKEADQVQSFHIRNAKSCILIFKWWLLSCSLSNKLNFFPYKLSEREGLPKAGWYFYRKKEAIGKED